MLEGTPLVLRVTPAIVATYPETFGVPSAMLYTPSVFEVSTQFCARWATAHDSVAVRYVVVVPPEVLKKAYTVTAA